MSVYDQFTSNMPLIKPQDAMPLVGAGLPSGFRSSLLDAAGVNGGGNGLMTALQNPLSPEGIANINKNAAEQAISKPESGMSEMDMYRLASSALQGMNRPQAFPSGNTAQIMRDQNRFFYAQNPQQQMAQALRQRG